MFNKKQNEIDILRLLQIIFRKKWIVIGCMILVLLPIIYSNQKAIPIYESSTLIVFDRQANQFSMNNSFPFRYDRSFIANQIEEIRSFSLAEDVTKALPKKLIEAYPISTKKTKIFNKINYIAYRIHKDISASAIPNTDVIKIKVRAPSPDLSKDIANTVTNVLEKRNLTVKREETNNAIQMIKGQLEKYKKKLSHAEVALKNYKEINKIAISPDQESIQIFQRITNAEVLLNQTKSNRESTESRLKYIKEKIKEQKKGLVPTITEVTSPWIQKLKENLVDLEVQYTNLRVQNYSSNHPKMTQLKNEIEKTKKNLKKETVKLAQGQNLIDPLSQIQKFLEESISLDVEIETYKAQENALKRIIDNYNFSLKSVPEKELELERLIRGKNINEQIYTMLLQKYEEMKIAEAQKIGNIRVIDPAKLPNSPILPRKMLNLIVGLFLGIMVGITWVIISDYLDVSIKSAEYLEDSAKYSVLATIPYIKNHRKKVKSNQKIQMNDKLITAYDPRSPISETYRTLRTNIQFSSIDNPLKKILVTSANPSEGKSITAANLATVTAQMGTKTLLIDADFRKPTSHIYFNLKREPGLFDDIISLRTVMKNAQLNHVDEIFQHDNLFNKRTSKQFQVNIENYADINSDMEDSEKKMAEFLYKYIYEATEDVIQKTKIANLDLLTAGRIPPNPSNILSSKIFKEIINVLISNYDIIIFDSPPVTVVTDATLLSSLCDGVLIVVKAENTSIKDVKDAISNLRRTKTKIVGFAYNQAEKPKSYGQNKYYYYYNDNHKNSKKNPLPKTEYKSFSFCL